MAKISHTFNSYLEKPMDKGTSAFQLSAVRKELDYKYRMISDRTKIQIENVCKHDKSYFVHYKIPSEDPRNKNTYDVVLQFTPKNMLIESESTVKNYNIKFFSNSPGFMYTFGYVYKMDGLFIEEFVDKYDSKIFSLKPSVKNPYKIVNYEKTIYFAMMSFKSNSVHFNKGYLDSKIGSMTLPKFKKLVRHATTIKREIIKEKNRVKQEKETLKNNLKSPEKMIKSRTKSTKNVVVHKPITAKTSTSKSNSAVKKSTPKITAKRRIK